MRALASAAGDAFLVDPPAGGMQLLARYRQPHDDRDLSARLAHAGVTARPLSTHFTGRVTDRGLFLGFAAWDDKEIDAGARILGHVARTYLASASRIRTNAEP